jgi:hypothetical protein
MSSPKTLVAVEEFGALDGVIVDHADLNIEAISPECARKQHLPHAEQPCRLQDVEGAEDIGAERRRRVGFRRKGKHPTQVVDYLGLGGLDRVQDITEGPEVPPDDVHLIGTVA